MISEKIKQRIKLGFSHTTLKKGKGNPKNNKRKEKKRRREKIRKEKGVINLNFK